MFPCELIRRRKLITLRRRAAIVDLMGLVAVAGSYTTVSRVMTGVIKDVRWRGGGNSDFLFFLVNIQRLVSPEKMLKCFGLVFILFDLWDQLMTKV